MTSTVRGEAELTARLGHMFAGPWTEFLCAATDLNTWSRPEGRPSVASAMPRAVADGLVIRKLYTAAALADEEQRLHLLDIVTAGGQVRICATELPNETIIIDRRVMVLAGPAVMGDREFTVATEPALVDGVHAMFDAAWETATELAVFLRGDAPRIDPAGRRILQALGDGLTDETAARRLGLSLRTYRRRVAELMRLLEAESRFQAGVLAGRLGITP